MPRETFKKRERITKRADFIRRHPDDTVVHTRAYRVIFKPSTLPYSRLGVVVTRKNGNAVFRNRVKRVLREAFRKNKARIQPPADVIVIRGKLSGVPTFHEAEESFLTAIHRYAATKNTKDTDTPA